MAEHAHTTSTPSAGRRARRDMARRTAALMGIPDTSQRSVFHTPPAPVLAALAMLLFHTRPRHMEAAAAALIDRLDQLAGDPDLEADDDNEQECHDEGAQCDDEGEIETDYSEGSDEAQFPGRQRTYHERIRDTSLTPIEEEITKLLGSPVPVRFPQNGYWLLEGGKIVPGCQP